MRMMEQSVTLSIINYRNKSIFKMFGLIWQLEDSPRVANLTLLNQDNQLSQKNLLDKATIIGLLT